MEIQEIRLQDALPQVFRGEVKSHSGIWLTDVAFRKGTDYIVAAESGKGKSSLCAYVYGARKDYDGHIYFNDTDISTLTVPHWQEIRRRHLAYLPQDLGLFPELTAMENIRLKNDLTSHFTEEQLHAMLSTLGIAERANFPVGKMSIGQQQRVAIVRTLCQPFDFLWLDEPVSHLDETNNRIVADLVEREARSQNASIISTSVGNHLMLSNALTLYL